MGLEKKREADDAQRRATAHWKRGPTDCEKQVSCKRSKQDWKALRGMSRNEYQARSPSRPTSAAAKKALARPATDVQGAVEGKLAGGVVVARADSRAQSASLDQTAMSAVVNANLEYKARGRAPAPLLNSIPNARPVDTRTKGTVSPTEKSDALQLFPQYQNSDLRGVVHKGMAGLQTLMERPPSNVSIRSHKSRPRSRGGRKSEMELARKSQESKQSERINSRARMASPGVVYKPLHQTDIRLDPALLPQHNDHPSSD